MTRKRTIKVRSYKRRKPGGPYRVVRVKKRDKKEMTSKEKNR